MDILHNTRPAALTGLDDVPFPSVDADAPMTLLRRCPAAGQTPLVSAKPIATQADVAEVWIKDERGRMGLGSFKALGAAYVIAHDAEQGNAKGATYVTASAGNHGMSVAAGAAAFGARAVVYIAQTVPEAFAARLADQGAEVVRAGETYEASMEAAAQAASENGWRLLSDSSWEGYMEYPHRVMEGYLALMAEAIEQDGAGAHPYLFAGRRRRFGWIMRHFGPAGLGECAENYRGGTGMCRRALWICRRKGTNRGWWPGQQYGATGLQDAFADCTQRIGAGCG